MTKKVTKAIFDEKKILAFAQKLEAMSRATEELRRLFIKSIPEELIPYGSELWWEKEHVLAKEEIEAGQLKEYDSVEDLIADLHRAVEEHDKKNRQNRQVSASVPQYA